MIAMAEGDKEIYELIKVVSSIGATLAEVHTDVKKLEKNNQEFQNVLSSDHAVTKRNTTDVSCLLKFKTRSSMAIGAIWVIIVVGGGIKFIPMFI